MYGKKIEKQIFLYQLLFRTAKASWYQPRSWLVEGYIGGAAASGSGSGPPVVGLEDPIAARGGPAPPPQVNLDVLPAFGLSRYLVKSPRPNELLPRAFCAKV